MPYLARAAAQVSEAGTPMLRPMVLEFPDDPATEHVDTQYMLGDSLLVAPVFAAHGRVCYYVPEGTWTHLLDGHTVSGPCWVREDHGFESLPLLVRPGSVIPFGARDDRPDYDYPDGVELRPFGLHELTSVAVEVPALGDGAGATFELRRDGDLLICGRTAGADLPWSVVLPAGAAVARADGGELDESTDRTGLRVRAVSEAVSITLAVPRMSDQ
jgi:alpha-D-xyloside xylohydrolase